MAIYRAGESCKPGFYFAPAKAHIRLVKSDETVLAGKPSTSYYRLPALFMLIVMPPVFVANAIVGAFVRILCGPDIKLMNTLEHLEIAQRAMGRDETTPTFVCHAAAGKAHVPSEAPLANL